MDLLLTPVSTTRKVTPEDDSEDPTNANRDEDVEQYGGKFAGGILKMQKPFPGFSKDFAESDKGNAFLTESSSSKMAQSAPQPRNQRHQSTIFLKPNYWEKATTDTLVDEARATLRSNPNYEDLVAVLQYLQHGIEGEHGFDIRQNTAQGAQIINTLVTVTLPDYWQLWCQTTLSTDNQRVKAMFVSCLTSVAGVGALLMQIKQRGPVAANTSYNHVLDIVDVLSEMFSSPNIIFTFIQNVLSGSKTNGAKHARFQEMNTLIAGSKVLATVAHAISKFPITDLDKIPGAWLGNGVKYSTWLANRIAFVGASLTADEDEKTVVLGQLLKRGLSLGYCDDFVSELYTCLLLRSRAMWTSLHMLLAQLPRTDQGRFLNSMLQDLGRKYLTKNLAMAQALPFGMENQSAVRGVAAILKGVATCNIYLENQFIEWLTTTANQQALLGLDIRRAVVASLAFNEERLRSILKRCLESFSDKGQMNHMPILQQEAIAQTILLTIGYLHRLDDQAIRMLSRSSLFVTAVSNRLAASLPRARFLGMIVALAVSKIVDDPDKLLNFDVEEMAGEEAKSWLNIVMTEDGVGTLEDLKKIGVVSTSLQQHSHSKAIGIHLAISQPPRTGTSSKVVAIDEIYDLDEQDVIPYPKPDEDLSDSEEDPTLIDRSKPTAPVYIRDLVKALQTSDKPDVLNFSLQTAPSLIRRKAAFGSELEDHIFNLLRSLINVQDVTPEEEVSKLQAESLVACIVALPKQSVFWMISTYFEGDISVVQRALIISTIALGARELAGENNDKGLDHNTTFPSQKLPAHLKSIYGPVDALARDIESTTLQPMAFEAADKLLGPDILKVRKFSSRLDDEKKVAKRSKERRIHIKRDLHRLLAESFYLPLCCRMTLLISHLSSRNASIFEPSLMKLFLQTLTVLVNYLGPHALQLGLITRETLNLLLVLHNVTSMSLDPVVLPPLLQLLLSMLDVNIEAGTAGEERLVTDFGTMMAELIAWVSSLTELPNLIASDASESMPWTVLAAGCQVKWHEVGRKFQGRMMSLVVADAEEF